MCITGSVGRGGTNHRDDVRMVQLLLNLNHPQMVGPLVPDGNCTAETIATIEQYARGVVGGTDAAWLVTPAGTTLKALRAGMPAALYEEKLEAIFVHASAASVAKFYAALLAVMAAEKIDTPLRQAHFLAQVGHESGELRYTEELASGAAYEGRADLGNTEPGDGVRFKGRGLIQLTGRANYKAFGEYVGRELCAGENPRLVASEPALCVGAAAWFWREHDLNGIADKDDLKHVTRVVNGGTNGLTDRQRLLERAKWLLLPGHRDAGEAGLLHAIQAVAGEEPAGRTHRRFRVAAGRPLKKRTIATRRTPKVTL